jgi:hypothetical protein
MLEEQEEERHARMRLEADRAPVARGSGEARPRAHVRVRKLEFESERVVKRLRRARRDGEH